jgi:phosphoribosylformylglycinamidine (FGAM) synthase PurS component
LLKARIESLLAKAGDAGGDTSTGSVHRLEKAAEAEQRVKEEVRQMGNEVLSNWAESRVEKAAAELVAGGGMW